MSVLKATRAAQYPLVAQFQFVMTDTMVDVNGVSKAFKAAAPVMDVIKLPNRARVIGGSLLVEVVSNESGTSTLKVGDSAVDDRYLGATTLKTAARTALVPTIFRGAGEDIRITLANQNADATAGTVTIQVWFIIEDKANEVVPN